MLLARSAGPRGRVIAGDLREHRLRAIQEQLTRTAITNVLLVALDATRPLPFARPFDRVLIDAPCSGTGTLSRNPEIRWRLKPEDLDHAHCCQTAMLRNGLAAVSAAGRLVYSTCSLEPEENEEVVVAALSEARDWRITSGQPALAPHLLNAASAERLFTSENFFHTLPSEHGTDGFFAAIFERRDEAV
jgi:16S rRNA (cytosine967-C5)-methyltransferase